MSVYISRIRNISAVAEELSIDGEDPPSLTTDQQDILAEFLTLLAEVRRVARQLETDQKATMSRTPRLLRELHETLLMMAGTFVPSLMAGTLVPSLNTTGGGSQSAFLDIEESTFELQKVPTEPSSAIGDKQLDESRRVRLQKSHSKVLSVRLADSIKARLGKIWEMTDEDAAAWNPALDEEQEPYRSMHDYRRVLLFHIASVMDINESSLGYLSCTEAEKIYYRNVLYKAVVREAIELDDSLSSTAEQLEVILVFFTVRCWTHLLVGDVEDSKLH